jgi:hypothetical protein
VRQSTIPQVEIELGDPKHYRHLGAVDIIGNEAEYYSAEPISAQQTSRTQKDLVYAVPVNATITLQPESFSSCAGEVSASDT